MMENDEKRGTMLDDDMLEEISGGIAEEGNATQKMCPLCPDTSVTFSRRARIGGAFITLYKCGGCMREYSFAQIKGLETLAVDYTNKGSETDL